MTIFNFNVLNANSLECVSMNNQECKARPKIIYVNTNEPVFYQYSIKVNKCSESCNGVNDPYAKLCVPDIIKNINVRVFNLMQRINETKHTILHKTCKCVCKLPASVSNSRQIYNEDKCRCECKEDLIVREICDEEYIWNPSTCVCECYVDYNETLNEIPSKDCASCTLYVVLFALFLTISVIIGGVFVYFHCYLKRNDELDRKKRKGSDLIPLVN